MTAPVPPRLPPQPFGPDEHKAVQKAMGLPMVGKLYVVSKGDPLLLRHPGASPPRCLNNGRL